MGYAIAGSPTSAGLQAFGDELAAALEQAGFERTSGDGDPEFVLNLVDPAAPRPFRRHSRGTYVAALHERPVLPDDVLAATYPLLVRTLANIVLCYVPGRGVWFTTMEQGSYSVEAEDAAELARGVVERLAPLARSHLVIDNDFRPDLEPELWSGDELTDEIRAAGRRLDELDLLPAPFPIEQLLDERDLRHVRRLYGIGGLSYGNLSARKDAQRFWMSASGVDKSKLEVPGRDILLVSGYDAAAAHIVLSVPPGIEPRRVSVDAIEHWMIYQAHPDVGAILHVHAWLEGIAATETNYPCGTEELAQDVADLVMREPDPSHAVIGLRNHGITATGESLTEILERIEARVLRQVPMS
ncbi:MAG TPA: class II aldolase/adducin family protein [Gaiellaceae bacterium]|nr:class II aldolase/adducin family protein [Gaiellaceae bacterium]